MIRTLNGIQELELDSIILPDLSSIQFPNPNIHVAAKEDVAANAAGIAELSTTTTNLEQNIQTLSIKDGETQTKIGNLQQKTNNIFSFTSNTTDYLTFNANEVVALYDLKANRIFFKKTDGHYQNLETNLTDIQAEIDGMNSHLTGEEGINTQFESINTTLLENGETLEALKSGLETAFKSPAHYQSIQTSLGVEDAEEEDENGNTFYIQYNHRAYFTQNSVMRGKLRLYTGDSTHDRWTDVGEFIKILKQFIPIDTEHRFNESVKIIAPETKIESEICAIDNLYVKNPTTGFHDNIITETLSNYFTKTEQQAYVNSQIAANNINFTHVNLNGGGTALLQDMVNVANRALNASIANALTLAREARDELVASLNLNKEDKSQNANSLVRYADFVDWAGSPKPFAYVDTEGRLDSGYLFDNTKFPEYVFGVADPYKSTRYLQGLVPQSNGEDHKYLRADGQWVKVDTQELKDYIDQVLEVAEGFEPTISSIMGDVLGLVEGTKNFEKLEVSNDGSQETIGLFKSTSSDCSVRIEGKGEAYLELANTNPNNGSTTKSWGIGTNDNDKLEFNWKPLGTTMNATQNVMTMTNNGKVGIKLGHNVAPTQELDVNGTVKAATFIGNGSALTNLPVNAQIDVNAQQISSIVNQLSTVPDFDPIAAESKMCITSLANGGTIGYITPSTDFINEGNNLYYTVDRANAQIQHQLASGQVANIVANQIQGQVIVAHSDRSLKVEIQPLLFDIVDQLRPVKYRFKHQHGLRYGFVAQDVKKIAPELVVKDSSSALLSLNYLDMIAHLVSKVQKLEKRLSVLEHLERDGGGAGVLCHNQRNEV